MRPTRDDSMLEIARIVAARSTCSRAHVGAVVARDARILSSGYNGAPSGMEHCFHPDPELIVNHAYGCPAWNNPEGECLCSRPTKGQDEGCKISVHAEVNTIAYAARYGIELNNSTLYTTLTPCLACSQLVINSGIDRVVCASRYRDMMGVDLLKRAGLVVDIIG